MGLTTTVERARIAALAAVQSVRRPGFMNAGEERAWSDALRMVAEALKTMFNTGDHADPPAADLETAARKFCFDVCPAGEEAAPGKHLRCGICPLKRFTLDPVVRGAREAVEKKSLDDSGGGQ